MEKLDWKRLTKHGALGLATMALGVTVCLTPMLVGEWVFSLLGIVFVVAGLVQFAFALYSKDRFATFVPYFAGAVCIVFGALVFLSPNITMLGLLVILLLVLVVDGSFRIYSSFKKSGADRWWTIANGLFSFFLAVVADVVLSSSLGLTAIGVVLGLWLIVEGWTMLFVPERDIYGGEVKHDPRMHPDWRLGLEPDDAIKELQDAQTHNRSNETSQNFVHSLSFIGLFFAIHLLRTDADWTWLGFISPFAAVVGDVVLALLFGVVLILPLRMFWRFVTRPIERVAWARFEQLNSNGLSPTLLERSLKYWLGLRLRFALALRQMRYSANYAFWRLLSYGLPIAALFIAVNSIWGFSWYFNSENWASAVWQEITKGRINAWRARAATDVENYYVARGTAKDSVFAIAPDGVDGSGDFGFVVIGDTGEGDASQMILRDQLIASGKRDEIKFLVVSSDVIYPDGKMKDYEHNFYLPFKGFDKPIYAIPGNHDWFDSDDGFNANFLERPAAVISMGARLREDLNTDALTDEKMLESSADRADQLRNYYGIKNGKQRAPFFEFHTKGFSLIAGDTGIMREFDDKQKEWFDAALTRAGDNFKMVILGHPFYVAGKDTAADNEQFREIHDILRKHHVDVAMAGDTHDFENYRERYTTDNIEREMVHFVNGGGGAYLSVGTAVAFPDEPFTHDYAFYPRTDQVNAKLDAETPAWKWPFLYWMRWFGGYPFDSEMVSGAFDFNHAPFFQSFMEVRVERSLGRVRFLLYGADGALRWRDIQTSGAVIPIGASSEDQVEFIVPMHVTAVDDGQ